jgi:hypothetical protein
MFQKSPLSGPGPWLSRLILGCAACSILLVGCDRDGKAPKLSKVVGEIPKVPVPPENGPPLAATADLTPVWLGPNHQSMRIGYLHAGARVARAAEPYGTEDCAGGWYPVRPGGFVCLNDGATLDMRHPTLTAMAILPNEDQELPYAYARTRTETALFERDATRDAAVKVIGKLKKRAGMAVVGSWNAALPDGNQTRLALLTNGKFVRAEDLEAAKSSEFSGVELGKDAKLPLAWVLRDGVRLWKLDGTEATKGKELDYHKRLSLTGRFRTVDHEKFWATEGGDWVRHKDVTVALARSKYPDFAKDGQRWIDISVVTGILIAYEGKTPLFATLASVTRPLEEMAPNADTSGMPTDVVPAAVTAPRTPTFGTFTIRGKQVTAAGANPREPGEGFELYDVPWVMELDSGKTLYGAYWHDRFGIEHGPGAIQLAPGDAHRLFSWVTPALPRGFHGYSPDNPTEGVTYVVIRK